MKKIIPTEQQEQIAFVDWCHIHKIPVIHIPNQGKRSVVGGALLKRAGLMKGVSDLFLPVPIQGTLWRNNIAIDEFKWFHGIFIEMKRNKNYSYSEWIKWEDQKNFLEEAHKNDYLGFFSFGAEHAIKQVTECISGNPYNVGYGFDEMPGKKKWPYI